MYLNSSYWVNYFTDNAQKHRINWNQNPQITDSEKAQILRSLQAWQLGETSEGTHLLAAANRYAKKKSDYIYPIAITLFIREEQKHGRNLKSYLDAIGAESIQKDWGDSLFRKIRYFNQSMEVWTIAVLTVESAAQLYYQALHDATNCPLLKEICNDILIDEEAHITFQSERLYDLFHENSSVVQWIKRESYRLFFFGTATTIYFAHQSVLKTNFPTLKSFLKSMNEKFSANFSGIDVQKMYNPEFLFS